jgi:hypothetical protein
MSIPPAGQPNQPDPAQINQIAESIFGEKRSLLAEKLTVMLIDLGGLTYEMAIRDHFRLDVLVRKAAELQAADAELGQLDRLLSLGHAGAAGECPSCGALHARGAAFCAQCGFEIVKAAEAVS